MLTKEKWELVGDRNGYEVYACLNSQGDTCWYINHAKRSKDEINDGFAVPPADACPGPEPIGFRPLACDRVSVAQTHSGDCSVIMAVPAEQPKVDPYEAHRLQEEVDWVYGAQRCRDDVSGATARLHAGLESEKVREPAKAFPHPARNPR